MEEAKSEKLEYIVQKIELILKNKDLKQEEIIWSRKLLCPKSERVFNRLKISDVFQKKEKFYVLYFEGLDLNVTIVYKKSNDWQSENETFLENTSESYGPIIEAKFTGKKPKIFAKKNYGGLNELIYEWKLKKGKWTLIKEKEVKIFLKWNKRKSFS